jgi:hypothetical protein
MRAASTALALVVEIAASSVGRAETPMPGLFGFTIGDRLGAREDFIPFTQDRDFVRLTRLSTNKKYFSQGLALTKKTMTIARISATANHETQGECESQLFAVIDQLKRKHLGIEEEITRFPDWTYYSLSYVRDGCSYTIHTGGDALTVRCTAHYSAYCDKRGRGTVLNLEVGDTAISEQARRESKKHDQMKGPAGEK